MNGQAAQRQIHAKTCKGKFSPCQFFGRAGFEVEKTDREPTYNISQSISGQVV